MNFYILSALILLKPLYSNTFSIHTPPSQSFSASSTVSSTLLQSSTAASSPASSSSSSSTQGTTTWFIDGTNLQHQKSIPRSRVQIAENLLPCATPDSTHIVLVFDNGRDDTLEGSTTEEEDGSFRTVITPATQSADDYIISEIQKLSSSFASGSGRKRNGGRYSLSKVNVVTADKGLRRLVLKEKKVVDVVVNPITFWKKYKSRLSGFKSTYENKPKEEE